MKKVLAFILCAVMLTAFAGCGAGNSDSSKESTTQAQTTQEPLSDDVKKQLDDALAKEQYKGVAQISRGGEVIYQYVSGNDDNGQPLTTNSSLPLASVSKQFCAAAVMLLREKNLLTVDDTLDKYYPDYKYGKKITIKNLLNMSSGIPDYYSVFMESPDLGGNEKENVKKIKEVIFGEELGFEPGEDFEYSNSNYYLLADIVEQVSGEKYHDYIRKNIFDPLEMKNTGFVEDISENLSWASAFSQKEPPHETSCPGLAKGAGDIISNGPDMDKWMRGLSSGKVVSADSYKQMKENVNENSSEGYGYGLSQMPYDGVGHPGQMPPSYGAVDYLNSDRDVYIFAATNDPHGSSFVQQLPQTLLDILLKT